MKQTGEETLAALKRLVADFRDERDWKQFHNPKDLALALSIEASELLEHFLWISSEHSSEVVEENRQAVEEEMADVFAFLLALADATGTDLGRALKRKMEKNRLKYPVEKSQGVATKYDRL